MKTVVGPIAAALVASACCIGPVLLSALGAGALGAAAVRLAPYRPAFLALTAGLLGAAFYATYRSAPPAVRASDGSCAPGSKRTAKIVLWIATVLIALLVSFPYYVNFLVE